MSKKSTHKTDKSSAERSHGCSDKKHCHPEGCSCGHCHEERRDHECEACSSADVYSTPMNGDSPDIDKLTELANHGVPMAQYDLGVCYNSGLVVEENPQTAAQWFFKAAQQADGDAQFALGRLYLEGRGVPQMDDAARKWFEVAAQHGHAASQNQMGYLYLHGIGVEKNPMIALHWWLESAENGFPEAMFNLALWYAKGECLQPDEQTAMDWLRKAADAGFPPAVDFLEQMESVTESEQ
ncbi:MAG: sel1 repeat family protein [Thermoguttaceae bacterium]|nr:sel1 repeat family protein [Thermoguttaceae bacterium]